MLTHSLLASDKFYVILPFYFRYESINIIFYHTEKLHYKEADRFKIVRWYIHKFY